MLIRYKLKSDKNLNYLLKKNSSQINSFAFFNTLNLINNTNTYYMIISMLLSLLLFFFITVAVFGERH